MGFSYSPKVVTDGLVLYLDAANPLSYASGSTSWNDLSRGRNSGTLINGTSFSDRSFQFDGTNQYIEFGQVPSLQFTGDFTATCWFKKDTSQSFKGLFGNANYRNGGFHVALFSNNFYFTINNSTTEQGTGFSSSHVLDDNQWYYGVGTFSNGVMTTYVDGEVTNSRSSVTMTENSSAFRVGTSPQGGWNYLDGNIAIASVYNRALSAQEVQRNYQALKSRFGL